MEDRSLSREVGQPTARDWEPMRFYLVSHYHSPRVTQLDLRSPSSVSRAPSKPSLDLALHSRRATPNLLVIPTLLGVPCAVFRLGYYMSRVTDLIPEVLPSRPEYVYNSGADLFQWGMRNTVSRNRQSDRH